MLRIKVVVSGTAGPRRGLSSLQFPLEHSCLITTSAFVGFLLAVNLGVSCSRNAAPPESKKAPVEEPEETRKRLRAELESWNDRVGKEPNNAQTLYERARARRRLRSYVDSDEKAKLDQEAIADFESAHKLATPPGFALALVEAGRVKLGVFDFDSAMEYFAKAKAIDPQHIEVRAELAKMEGLMSGSWATPLVALEELTKDEQGSQSPGVWHAVGLAYLESGRPVDAEKAFRRKLELSPDDVRTWSAIALALEAQGKGDEALAAHRKLSAADPTDIYTAINQANTLLGSHDRKKAQEAVDLLLPGIKKVPGVPAAWNNLGNAYAQLENYEQARKAYQQAIDLQPKFADAYSNLGLLFIKERRYEDAISSFRQALEISPDHPPFLYDLAVSQTQGRLFQDAEATYARLSKLDPNDPRVWNNYGGVLLELNKKDEARRAYKKSLQLNPRHAKALGNLGRIALNERDNMKALEYLQKALAIDPNDIGTIENLGNVYIQMRDYDRGLEAVRTLRPQMKNPAPGSLVMCSILFHAGKDETAIEECNRAIQSDSTRSWAFLQRGAVQLGRGQYDDAIADFVRASELDATDVYAPLLNWVANARSASEKRVPPPVLPLELADRWPKDSWQRWLIDYVSGTVNQDALMKAMTNEDQSCEGFFYIAEKRRSVDGLVAAKEWYQKCAATNAQHFIEHAIARRQ